MFWNFLKNWSMSWKKFDIKIFQYFMKIPGHGLNKINYSITFISINWVFHYIFSRTWYTSLKFIICAWKFWYNFLGHGNQNYWKFEVYKFEFPWLLIESLIPALDFPSKTLLTKWIKAWAFSMRNHLPPGNHGSHNLNQAYPSFLTANYYCTGTQIFLNILLLDIIIGTRSHRLYP